MRRIAIGLVLCATAVSAWSQPAAPERVIIPTVFSGLLPGGYGSEWKLVIVGRNDGDAYVKVSEPFDCNIECPTPPAQPHSTFELNLSDAAGLGAFVYIENPGSDEVSLDARIQDVSRPAETWGTELPIVRQGDTFTRTLGLLNVPTSPAFRSTLRIYDYDIRLRSDVRVRFYDMITDELLAEVPVTLSTNSAYRPPQARMIDVAAIYPHLRSAETVRISVEPVTPGLRFWAFVSVTNDVTQHVTMVRPDNPR
ncbi:MAG: hypothetical protein WBX15_05030 [Thermoanaerobaculia bacterium]